MNKVILAILFIISVSSTSCTKCESLTANGTIKGKALLVGTLEPAAEVEIQLVQNEIVSGFPPSTITTKLSETYTNAKGEYIFTDVKTGPSEGTDVKCYWNSELYYNVEEVGGDIRQTDCGIKKDFILYPKAQVLVKLGTIELPDSLSSGSIWTSRSDNGISFTKTNPPTGKVVMNAKGNVSDTVYLRFKKRGWVVNRHYPNGIEAEVTDKIIKFPFYADAWEQAELEINYP